MPVADPASTTSPTATTAGSSWERPPSGRGHDGDAPQPCNNLSAVHSESLPSAGNGPCGKCDWCRNRPGGCAFCRPSSTPVLGPIAWDPGRTSRSQEANPRTALPTATPARPSMRRATAKASMRPTAGAAKLNGSWPSTKQCPSGAGGMSHQPPAAWLAKRLSRRARAVGRGTERVAQAQVHKSPTGGGP